MDPTGHKLKPRRHPRFLIHELVMVSGLESEKVQTILGYSSDLSEGGLSAEIQRDLPLGVSYSMWLIFRNEKEMLRCRAILRHRTGKAHGFEFINPSFAQLQLIRQICTRVSYQPAAGEMA